jgi:hypothetical protein
MLSQQNMVKPMIARDSFYQNLTRKERTRLKNMILLFPMQVPSQIGNKMKGDRRQNINDKRGTKENKKAEKDKNLDKKKRGLDQDQIKGKIRRDKILLKAKKRIEKESIDTHLIRLDKIY